MMIGNDDLINILLKHAPGSGSFPTKINGLSIARKDAPNMITRCVLKPIIIVSIQGKKRSVIGKEIYEYCAGQSMVIGMDLPTDSTVLEASPEKPYLSMVMELDAVLIAQISAKLPKNDTNEGDMKAVACAETDPAVFDAFCRLAELLDTPEQIQFLSPIIIKEIYYRLLNGALGVHIRAINRIGSQPNQIAQAITWLQNNYKAPLKIEKLAEHTNMAVSTFHRNFKLITTLSPLQFQKKLRLLEAQRLMLVKRENATNAAYEVGYESPTQFNREYKRMFGNSPKKDIMNIVSQVG